VLVLIDHVGTGDGGYGEGGVYLNEVAEGLLFDAQG
jgi:hypothetical protein